MKTSLIRLLTLITLATSMSAFAFPAQSNEARNGNCSTSSDTESASAINDVSGSEKGQGRQDGQQEKDKARQQLIEQQDKQWLHELQGIYGG
jgi:ABC-type transporter MlaC component